MITCSKCKKKFNIDWLDISKDSTIPCTYCDNQCLVTLFDLENISHESFSGVNNRDLAKPIEITEEETSYHYIVIIFCLTSFIMLFILGMYNIAYLEDNFPVVARFYNKIKVFARKSIAISSVSLEQDNFLITITLNLMNSSDHSQILNDIEILIMDSFHNVIAGTHIMPHQIIKKSTILSIKVNNIEQKDDLKNIRIFINGKIALEKSLPTLNKIPTILK